MPETVQILTEKGVIELLDELRQKGWSDTNLAKSMEISLGTINEWRTGISLPSALMRERKSSIMMSLIMAPIPLPHAPRFTKVRRNVVSLTGAARILGSPQKDVRSLLEAGVFPRAYQAGGFWVVPKRDVENYKVTRMFK